MSSQFVRAYNAAVAAIERGELENAKRRLKEALKLEPRHANALHHLGLVCQQLGDLGDAGLYLERAAAANPADPIVYNNLGNVLAAANRFEQALEAYSKAVEIQPEYINARYNLAQTLVKAGRLEEGIEAYRRALEIAPRDIDAHNALGVALMDAGRHEEAASVLEAALILEPDNAETHNNLGVYRTHAGDIDGARASFMAAIRSDPGYARAYENLARSRRFGVEDQALVDRLERLLSVNRVTPDEQMLCHFALGKILDDLGESERAFRHYRQGNRIKRSTIDFDRRRHSAWVDRVIATFTPALMASKRNVGCDSELPVFIVGMIRSGTTLVEQIVASHSAAAGAGELLFMTGLARDLPAELKAKADYPECVKDLDRATAARRAERYLERLRKVGAGAIRVTDKLPTNFLVLGLIALLFPRARIIHCRREPLDVCLSIYFQRFARGHDYAYDLGDIAVYYLEYERLMDHWSSVLPVKIHPVRYEELVIEQERVSRELIAFLGLDWDPSCLNFDRSERVVSTASSWQVRQPVYRSSVQRWRRYERFLEPLRTALGEHAGGSGGVRA